MAAKKENSNNKLVAQNRRARFDYFLLETFEAGLALRGTEVKSLREGKGNIQESYAEPKNGEVWLINAYIPEYQSKMPFGHEERRPRKLLLHKDEISRLSGAAHEKGLTIVALRIYIRNHVAKVELALAKGKRQYDKRRAIMDRDLDQEARRAMGTVR